MTVFVVYDPICESSKIGGYMPAPKKAREVPAPALRCTICQLEVTAETYAAHIQSAHASPPPAPSQAYQDTHTLAASMPSYNWMGPGTNNGLQPISGPIGGKELAGGKYLKGED